MLNADGAMQHRQYRLAFRLGVTVRHGDSRFFMQRGDPLGHHIRRMAVIDERFLQAFETRSGIGDGIFDSQVANGLDHEIGTRARDGAHCHRRPNVACLAL